MEKETKLEFNHRTGDYPVFSGRGSHRTVLDSVSAHADGFPPCKSGSVSGSPHRERQLGRDIFSRVMNGSGNTFLWQSVQLVIGGVIGMAAGALTGYYGGVLDNFLMRVGDMIMSFPSVLLY